MFKQTHYVDFNFNAPIDKLMDAIVPHNESSYSVDFHVLDPTSLSNRRIQHGNQVNSHTQSSLQHSIRCALTAR